MSESEMVDSSLSCVSSRQNDMPSATMVVDFAPSTIFVRGDDIIRHVRSVTAEEKTSKGCAIILANAYVTR